MVMASHAAGTRLVVGGAIPLGTAHQWGKVGVRVFFVISGFLITKLLIDEWHRYGAVSIRAFYVRRAYRILPAFIAYLGVLLVLSGTGVVSIPTNDLVHAATYTTNFDVERSWFVSHIWSLSVEEQFYLVWPVLFATLGKVWAFRAAVAACVLSPLSRYAIVKVLPVELDALVWQATPAVADSIATGCILAYLRSDTALPGTGALGRALARFVRQTRSTPLTYVLFPAAFLTYLIEDRPTVWTLLGVSFSNVGFALCIDRAVSTQGDPVGRLLVHPLLERVGVLSYSLYLWQQLFLRQADVDLHPIAERLGSFPISVVLAFATGALSYYGIERPLLRRRPRSAARS